MTDATGALIYDRVATPFGETASLTASGGTDLALRFPGQQIDQGTGLAYNYFRDYDPSLGRYVQSDPIGLGGGINTFAYVGGNPAGRIDPMGLWSPGAHYHILSGFGGSQGFSSAQVGWMNNGSSMIDSLLQQIWGDPALHAMRNPGESPEEARKRACDFINAQINEFHRLLQENVVSGWGYSSEESAFTALGRAMHPIMDSTSPAHSGWQVWTGIHDPNMDLHGDFGGSIEDDAHLNSSGLLGETVDRMNRMLRGESCECVLPLN